MYILIFYINKILISPILYTNNAYNLLIKALLKPHTQQYYIINRVLFSQLRSYTYK